MPTRSGKKEPKKAHGLTKKQMDAMVEAVIGNLKGIADKSLREQNTYLVQRVRHLEKVNRKTRGYFTNIRAEVEFAVGHLDHANGSDAGTQRIPDTPDVNELRGEPMMIDK